MTQPDSLGTMLLEEKQTSLEVTKPHIGEIYELYQPHKTIRTTPESGKRLCQSEK
jgi:hypothetical protein